MDQLVFRGYIIASVGTERYRMTNVDVPAGISSAIVHHPEKFSPHKLEAAAGAQRRRLTSPVNLFIGVSVQRIPLSSAPSSSRPPPPAHHTLLPAPAMDTWTLSALLCTALQPLRGGRLCNPAKNAITFSSAARHPQPAPDGTRMRSPDGTRSRASDGRQRASLHPTPRSAAGQGAVPCLRVMVASDVKY